MVDGGSAGKQNAQKQAGLTDGINNLGSPVGVGIIVFELILTIPAHEEHKTEPSDEEQNAGQTNDGSPYACPVNFSKADDKGNKHK